MPKAQPSTGFRSFSDELEDEIRDRVYRKKETTKDIALALNIPTHAISKLLKSDYWRTKDDTRLKQILKTDSNVGALDIIDNLFMSLMLSAKELQYNGVLSMEIREKISTIIEEEGVEELFTEKNKNLMSEYRKTTESIAKLSGNANEYMKTYLTMFRDVLEVQRDVSYIRVVTDVLSKLAPEVKAKLNKGLSEDPVMKAMMNKISTNDVENYFVDSDSIVATINKTKTLDVPEDD